MKKKLILESSIQFSIPKLNEFFSFFSYKFQGHHFDDDYNDDYDNVLKSLTNIILI